MWSWRNFGWYPDKKPAALLGGIPDWILVGISGTIPGGIHYWTFDGITGRTTVGFTKKNSSSSSSELLWKLFQVIVFK